MPSTHDAESPSHSFVFVLQFKEINAVGQIAERHGNARCRIACFNFPQFVSVRGEDRGADVCSQERTWKRCEELGGIEVEGNVIRCDLVLRNGKRIRIECDFFTAKNTKILRKVR